MAKNTFLSAGVYTREFDLSFYPARIPVVGASVVGPTVRGPALVPQQISTYSDYIRLYGDVFSSGSGIHEADYKYLTTYAVQEYLRFGETMWVTRIMAGTYAAADSNVISHEGSSGSSFNQEDMAFKLVALSEGELLNSGDSTAATSGSGISADIGTSGSLVSGSKYNIRWEVANVDTDRGTFDLYLRRGDDNDNRKIILEQYAQLSLDPNTSNYIKKVIGDQTYQIRYDSGGEPYLEKTGSNPNGSRFVRVESVNNTLNYLKNDGTIRDPSMSGSLPTEVSGTFGGGSDGNVEHPRAMNGDIFNNNTQGYNPAVADSGKTAYEDAFAILSNTDQYEFNLFLTPGLIDGFSDHSRLVTRAINMVEDRGDAFYIIDPTYRGGTVGQARQNATGRNSNYAAYYYPWIQVRDNDLGGNVWVPPSAVLPGVFSFNDYAAEKWFAPAGLRRGGIDTAVQTERFMSKNDRDNLYVKSVNPIAEFPRQGVVVWGQKTLQKKRSALDRINVRRLLIAAKRHVSEQTKRLVFEQNTEATRTEFLNLTRPWFEDVRRKQGLYDFKIIIDRSNNTPEVIDRNEMRAAIYLKPTKTAEFIIVDFYVMPTGAEFPSGEQEGDG